MELPGTGGDISDFKRYGVAIACVILAFLIRFFLSPFLGESAAFALFTPAVIISAWYGGIGPALVASVSSLLLANYFFVQPYSQWSFPSPLHVVFSGIYLFVSVVVAQLVNALRREQQQVVDESRQNLNRADALQREMESRKQAEQQLRDREEHLRLIFENAHGVAIISYDIDGNINDWNEGARRVFGYTADEILGQHCSVISTPEDRALHHPDKEMSEAREKKSCADDRWHLAKGNRRVCINGVTCAKFNHDGELVGYVKIARDNTEHQLAEEALRQSEWRFRKIFESAAVGIAEINPSGQFVNANERFCQIVDYTLPELLEHTFFDLRLPEDHVQDAEDFRKLMTGEIQVIEDEKRCIHKTGQLIWSQVTASFLRDESGNPLTCIAIVAEITERKLAEQKFRESQERLRLATESADIGLWHWDIESGKQDWSTIARQHLGLLPDSDASLENFMSCLHVEDYERVKNFCLASIQSRTFLDVEYRVIWPDKSVHWIWAKGRFLSGNGHQGHIFIGVTMDITARKIAAEQLQSAVALYQTILESTDDGILVVDLGGQVVAHNQKFGHMWKIPQSILQQKDDKALLECVLEQLVEPTFFLSKVRSLMRSEAGDHDELLFKDGRVFARMSQPHRINHQTVGRVWSFRDITALTRAREQLVAHSNQLESRVAERTVELRHALRDMEIFLYAIAHDLRAPLRAMSSFIDLLVDDYGSHLDANARDYCSRIIDGASRMNGLISDILSYGRLTHTEMPSRSVNLSQEVDKVIASSSRELEQRHGSIQVDKPIPNVIGDAALLDQIIENLVANAMKFVPREREPHLHIYAEEHDDNIRLCLEDNGIGIAPEDQDRIFGPFQRLHSVEQYPGTGIGLAIVQRGIEKMGGHVGVESIPGQGSRFWVELPKENGQHKTRVPP